MVDRQGRLADTSGAADAEGPADELELSAVVERARSLGDVVAAGLLELSLLRRDEVDGLSTMPQRFDPDQPGR
jgi:hypothetical protein